MKSKIWSPRILVRYTLLQLPFILLIVILLIVSQRIQAISSRIVSIILILWVAKDMILYPFVWRSYVPKHHEEQDRMAGAIAVTQERLDPSGYVQVYGELWRAQVKDNSSIEKDEPVKIIERKGLTLTVEPLQKRERN